MAPNTAVAKKAPRAWDALTPPLAEWILDAVTSMGYQQATPVQKATFDFFRGNKDVVVEAVTGSGKTLAYLIPIVERLLRADEPTKRNHVKAIVISPTRELATQIHKVLVDLLAFHKESADLLPYARNDEKRPDTADVVVIPQLCVGGTVKAADDLRTFLRLSPNLIIATPGRLSELLSSPHVKTPSGSFECLVLDEADRLLDMGFKESLSRILGFLPKTRRTGLFSASVSDAVQEIIRVGMLYPHKITVRVKSLKGGEIIDKKTPASLQMTYVTTPASHKIAAFCQLLDKLDPRPQRTIVFFSTCFAVKYFSRVLQAVLPPGFSLVALHGKLEPQVRERNFAKFLSATSPTILLTTDVAARGLDIPQVDLVVQIDPPSDTKNFIHRCGRAGRAGRRGLAVVFLQPKEEGYVAFLDVRKTPITPLSDPAIAVTDEEAARATAKIRQLALADREIFLNGTRAFVSWVRSYIEHRASSIFRVQDLDWVDLAHGWGLLELPKMPELRGLEVDRSLGLGVVTEDVAFKDKVRETKRLAELAEWKAARAASFGEKDSGTRAEQEEQKRKRNEAWSGKHEKEETKVVRREKKRRRKEAERQGTMSELEKEEQRKLEQMIEEIRKKNQAAAKAAAAAGGDDEFGGFDD
ncbi:DEAD-domain-containing protein [Coniochaeta ligniaria NRRL 30616]|uniref:ATP-dependent RNA helicase n=1 Tax=Coniochaeta ligniaria NRRL 30616 TaxID=1408157 RepID=A0A1J7JDA0_9PEZI|nr:DEAD-domain-containing protein [Coniochaeta ligniaria NRRL 30616]